MLSKRHSFLSLGLLLIIVTGISACKVKPKLNQQKNRATCKSEVEINSIKNTLDQFCALIEGTFIAYGKKNEYEEMKDVFITNYYPIFTDSWGEHWFYSEINMVELLEEPMEQSVMKIEKHSMDTLYIRYYQINNPERFILGWHDIDKLKNLTKEDLVESDNSYYTVVSKKSNAMYDVKDSGLSVLAGGSSSKAYYKSTGTIRYEGICISTTFYDIDKNISEQGPECVVDARDVNNKYHDFIDKKRKRALTK